MAPRAPSHLHVPCPVVAMTPGAGDHFFGFNDICPWDPGDRSILLLRTETSLSRLPDGRDEASVCIWTPETGEVAEIGRTRAFNYQQGARERWLGEDMILYNDVEAGRERALVADRTGRILRILPRAVYALSPDGRTGVSPSFGRHAAHFSGYGYEGAAAPSLGAACPEDDGIWQIDIETGADRLLISLAALAAHAEPPLTGIQIATHMAYDPIGARFLFVHGAWREDHALYARLMTVRADGSELACLASEKVTHPCWLDAETILCWARASAMLESLRRTNLLRHAWLRPFVKSVRRWQGRARNSLTGEGLTEIGLDRRRRLLARAAIREDGHFFRHPNRPRLIVGDTYPRRDNRLRLYLYHAGLDLKVEIADFDHGARWPDGKLRSDLHPRWNRAGTMLSVDIADRGVRRMALVDAAPALAVIDAELARRPAALRPAPAATI